MSARTAIGVDPDNPYSKAIVAGGFVHVKSQIGWDPETKETPDAIDAQTELALGNIERALASAGTTTEQLVKINVYLSDIDRDFDGMNAAYTAWFDARGIAEQPARTTVGTPLSWPELRIQVDAVALV